MSTNDKRIEAIDTPIKQLRAQRQQVEARKRAEESKRNTMYLFKCPGNPVYLSSGKWPYHVSADPLATCRN